MQNLRENLELGSCWNNLQLMSAGTDRLGEKVKLRSLGENFILCVSLKLSRPMFLVVEGGAPKTRRERSHPQE